MISFFLRNRVPVVSFGDLPICEDAVVIAFFLQKNGASPIRNHVIDHFALTAYRQHISTHAKGPAGTLAGKQKVLGKRYRGHQAETPYLAHSEGSCVGQLQFVLQLRSGVVES